MIFPRHVRLNSKSIKTLQSVRYLTFEKFRALSLQSYSMLYEYQPLVSFFDRSRYYKDTVLPRSVELTAELCQFGKKP
jgi:hypothetical protein